MKFRKYVALFGAAVLGLSLASCGKKEEDAKVTPMMQIGLGFSAKTATNMTNGDSPAFASEQVDVTYCVAAFNTVTKKIVSARFDCVQSKVEGTSAQVTWTQTHVDNHKCTADKIDTQETVYGVKTHSADAQASKLYQGDAYGMKNTSAAKGVIAGGAEADTQIEAFSAWCKGKTVAEIEAAVGATGYATDAGLKAGCTINLGEYVKAIKYASEHKASKKYDLDTEVTTGVGCEYGPAYNYGLPSTEVGFDMCGVILKGNKVVAAQFDALVVTYATDSSTLVPSVVTNVKYYSNGAYVSKKALGTAYGMKSTSAAKGVIVGGGEWNEQAEAMEKFVEGKDVTVSDYVTNGSYGAMSFTNISGCTITQTNYVKAFGKAGFVGVNADVYAAVQAAQ